jgi:hypothetical protein
MHYELYNGTEVQKYKIMCYIEFIFVLIKLLKKLISKQI